MYVEDFPLRLSQLRTAKGVSARDMSLSIGQCESYINTIENGKALPSMTSFFYICDYLGISPSDFFDINNRSPKKLASLVEDLKRLNDEELDSISTIVKSIAARK